jgi:type IV secretory pathway VirB3-like protein
MSHSVLGIPAVACVLNVLLIAPFLSITYAHTPAVLCLQVSVEVVRRRVSVRAARGGVGVR